MHIEVRSGMEAARLIRRDPGKYLNGVSGLYLLSLADCELGQVARSSYYFMRHVDDVLDEDRNDVINPLSYVDNLRSQIEKGTLQAGNQASELVNHSITVLEKRSAKGDNPRQDFLDAIDSVIFDYHRAQKREVLSSSELDDYYLRTFSPVLNLMFIGLQSSIRAKDIPELASAQGRIYSFRDLHTDWKRGIINIPGEVFHESAITNTSSVEDVRNDNEINQWLRYSLYRSKKEIAHASEILDRVKEPLTRRMCNGLINPMVTFLEGRNI